MQAIQLFTTKAADRQLSQREAPLNVQMELFFSCMIRKRVLFRFPEGVTTYPISSADDRVDLCFRPVMTKVCTVSEVEDTPDLEDFPIHRAEAFLPRWLRLDYQGNADGWYGEFGWKGGEQGRG
ncbi:MAG TPA: hypothetical protein VKA48_00070 [Gammaproteobacteria bacterium]|nr:hypothetical protein [Gammaproteobacteria bacterium]